MEVKECPYNIRGNARMSTYSCIDQADCPIVDCPEHGHFHKCYIESCRIQEKGSLVEDLF